MCTVLAPAQWYSIEMMEESLKMSRKYWTAVVALSLATAACSGDTAVSTDVASLEAEPAETTEAGPLEDLVELERALFDLSACMRDEGIDVGDPTVDADGNVLLGTPPGGESITDHGALMDAYAVCGDLIGGRSLGHGDADRTAVHDRLVEFASCVRDNGYDVSDPDFSNSDGELFPGLDEDDPDFQAAQAVCEELLVDDGDEG